MLRAKSSASCSAQFLPALGLAQGLRWPGTSQVWSCHRSENLPGLTPRSRPCRWCSSQRALLKLPTWHSALAVCPSSCHAIWQRKWSCPVDAKYPWPSTRTHSHPVGSGRKVLSAGTLDWRPESIEWSSTVPVAHGKRNEDCVGLERYVLNQYLIFHVAPESEGHPCVFRQTHNLILLWWIVTIL